MTTTETEPDTDNGLGDEATAEPAPATSTTGMPTVDKVYATVLESWKAANDRANEADRERRRLRKHVDLIPIGVWDGWQRSEGEPAEIVDMEKVAELLAQHGHEVPKKKGKPPLVVVQLNRA